MAKRIASVAPFTGAWIEIERKYHQVMGSAVAPFTGAWIEIHIEDMDAGLIRSRTLHGCVD